MERNQLIGFVLIFIILMWWSMMRTPESSIKADTDPAKTELNEISSPDANSEVSTSPTEETETLTQSQLEGQFASFSSSASGVESFQTLENDKIKLTFSNKGGKIISALIKDYYRFEKDETGEEIKLPVTLLDNEKNKFEYILDMNDKSISTGDLFFNYSIINNRITYSVESSSGGSFEQIYELMDNSYEIAYDIKLKGLQNELNRDRPFVTLNWINVLNAIEKNVMFEERYSSVYFKDKEEDSDYCNCMSDDVEEHTDANIEWVSHTHQFFNSSLIAKNKSFGGGVFSTQMIEGPNELKVIGTNLEIPYSHENDESMAMTMYIGPNEYDNLRSYGNDLEEIIPFGRSIFGDINRAVIRPAFDYLSGFIGSKGVVIIILIFILKMLLYPLYYKMLYSQAKMGALKPEIANLKVKFKDDSQKVQMETMKMYREYGVNPMGGCMPMIVQIPIWYALFRFFPASITFRQEAFLWASDLSSYDAFINLPFTIPMFGAHLSLFTILWAISQVVYTYYNMKHMDMSANPAMKYVQYLMPLMFFVYFNNYASGLTCYMFFSQLMNILQTVVTKKYVFDDEKIKSELNLNKENPKKKGKFQQRLEDAMKQQQLQQQKKPKKK